VPHFTLQIQPQGPLLTALVGVSQPRGTALTTAGQAIPAGIPIRALVDTGASCTCIDPSVMKQLGRQPTGVAQMHTPSSGSGGHNAEQFDVSLMIPGVTPQQEPLVFPTVSVIASDLLSAQGFHALIGRDILSSCILNYNGTMGFFTLAF
jgi:hypothetical protein